MSDVTIKQLAQLLNMPVDRLLGQLDEVGMTFSDVEQVVSSAEKMKLLGFLRRRHGKSQEAAVSVDSTPRQITLRRRKLSEIKVSTPGARGSAGSAKTVNLEVRARRTYVKRSLIAEEASDAPERLAAERKLAEAQQLYEREEKALSEAREAARQKEEERQQEIARKKQAAEEKKAAASRERKSAEVTMEAPIKEASTRKSKTSTVSTMKKPSVATSTAKKAKQEAAADKLDDRSEVATKAVSSTTDHSAFGMIVPRIHEPRKRKVKAATVKTAKPDAVHVSKPVPGAEEAKAKKEVTSDSARGSKVRRGRSRDDASGGKRFASGELHLSAAERARRSKRHGKSDRSVLRESVAPAMHSFHRPTNAVVHEVIVHEANMVADLAQKMAVKGAEVVKALFKMGVMVTINQTIDHDTAMLVVEELGHKPVEASANDAETALVAHTQRVGREGEQRTRPPVVTIMGHVDHGKTSLLDYIRRTRVASGEAGGITQHIGAYHVDTPKGVITFLDTPGHAAFTAMRARGAQSTDIVVLVVAADDGVKPQTVEAVKHARAARVPLIVALNKMDREDANPDHARQSLAKLEVIPEDWGGDTMFVPVSAKTGMGVEDLLAAVSLQAEMMELTALVDGPASGIVIESSLDKGRGPVATVLVQQGLLKRGDFVVCGVEYGRTRALIDETGATVQEAGPSIPVQVLGLSGVLEAGDDFVVVADEKLAKQVASERQHKRRETRLVSNSNRLEDIMAQMRQGNEQQTLDILIKADVQGSAEALREALSAIGNEDVKVNVISTGVGGITESDATLAAASKALLIGFNVRADASARKIIDTMGLDVRYFSIIYDVIDQVKQAASGLLGAEIREEIIGVAEVREVFRSSRFGPVAGCMVSEGQVKRSKPIRVLRDNTVIFEGELESLRRFKDLVDEVRSGVECGIAVKQYNDVKAGDQIECFERIEVARTL